MKQISPKESLVTRLFQSQRNYVYAIFRQACIPEADCEDLVQESFVKLLDIDTIREDTATNLLATIAYCLRTDYLRHRNIKHRTFSNNFNVDVLENEKVSSSLSCNEILLSEQEAIHKCAPLDSKVYCMSRFDFLSTEEIAVSLNLSKRAVEGRLYRSRKTVRSYVEKVANM